MQSLIFDRAVRKISPLEFATAISETFYSGLHQAARTDVFPSNCHANAAVNSLSLEKNDYQFLLSSCADSSIKLWDLKSQDTQEDAQDTSLAGQTYDNYDYDNPVSTFQNVATIPRRAAHTFGVSCIQWWPFDTGMFVSSSFDHTVKIWDTNELTPVHVFDMDNRVYSFDICGHSTNNMTANALVAVASDQPFLRLLDLRSTSSAHTLHGHKGKTLCVKWHPQDPNLLASGGFDGEVKIWDIRRSKSCLCRLDMLRTSTAELSLTSTNLTQPSVKAHLGPVNGLVWDEAGHTLFSAGNDDKVRVWDMVSTLAPPVNKLINFGPLTRNKYPQTIPLILSPKHESELQYLLFPSDNGDIFIFRTIDGKLVSRLTRKGTKNSGRTSSMVNAGPFSATYYCGTMDGEIVSWSPKWEQPNLDNILDPNIHHLDDENISKAKLLDIEKARLMLTDDPYFK